MRQRNMLCTSQMVDMDMDQQAQGHLSPEPCFLLGGVTNLQQPNVHTTVTSSYDGAVFYGMPQYNHGQDHHHPVNLRSSVPVARNSYVAPSCSPGLIPVPLDRGSAYQFPSSSNYGAIGVPPDNYSRNSRLMDGVGAGLYKRKNADGVPSNFQYHNASVNSGSSVSHFNRRHLDGEAVMDPASFIVPLFRSNGMIMGAGSQRSVRNGSGPTINEPAQAHSHNPLIQGNFIGQPFQPSGTHRVNQQISSNSNGGGASGWTQLPATPYMHGSHVRGGYVENGSMMTTQGHHETALNRNISSFMHPPPNHWHFNIHYPSITPVQGVRRHNANNPQVLGTSRRVLTNNALRNMMNMTHEGLEVNPRHPVPAHPTGPNIRRPHRGGDILETLRYRNRQLRLLPAEQVAILELRQDFYEVRNREDHHRDMRMDIEDMSYEELLALGDRIGKVSIGLSEEDIIKQMKTRTYGSSTMSINTEDPASSIDQESDSCTICQADYIKQEMIGTLGCGHEYHADCLKKWLLVKNVCPICKSEALGTSKGA